MKGAAAIQKTDCESEATSSSAGGTDSASTQSEQEDVEQGETDLMPKDPAGVHFSCKTFFAYVGPGWLMSLAYLDPGNLESDLQSGAYTGYSLLWVLMLCTVAGLILQILAARLAVATGRDLAQTCRAGYPRPLALTLWFMTELAIIGADIQEVVGTAIALKVLFGWPLWVGSLVTGFDTFTFLLMHYMGKRCLEGFIFLLVMLLLSCYFANFALMPPATSEIASGFTFECPSYAILQLVGTVGAVIMPHNIFLHSGLSKSRAVRRSDELHVHQANKYNAMDAALALAVSFFVNAALVSTFANGFFNTQCATNEGTTLACVPHAAFPSEDCVGEACKSCVAGEGLVGFCTEIGLGGAGSSLEVLFGGNGKLGRTLFAVGVLAAGQASTMTGTMAGQFVMEGFLEWHIPLWARTLLTRTVSLGPAVLVAILTSSDSNLNNRVNQWLNVLQSVQLPFALLPALHFNSDRKIMGDRFVLKKRYRTICWLLAGAIIAVNIYLVIDSAKGSSQWGWVVLFFVVYIALIVWTILSDLKRFLTCGLSFWGLPREV